MNKSRNRFSVFKKYLKNDRIKDYENILYNAKENGYEALSIRDWLALKDKNEGSRFLILRHDIDHVSTGTKLMLDAEKKYEFSASYYFRNCTADNVLIRQIEDSGSEVSLHYETLSDYFRCNDYIKNLKDLSGFDVYEHCLKTLGLNLDIFRREFGVEAKTIAAHGAPENKKFGVPNNRIMKVKGAHSRLGILAEAYDEIILNDMVSYISDCPIEINDGYRYGETPLECIERKDEVILFLTHPNHWHYEKKALAKKLLKVAVKGSVYFNESFKS